MFRVSYFEPFNLRIFFIARNEMAEVFGIIAGNLSAAAVFNNVVDCFGYVQLG